jgi:hypothetical protein
MLEDIMQSEAVKVDFPSAWIAPPIPAEFEVNVQLVIMTLEPPSAANPPPLQPLAEPLELGPRSAAFEVIVQSVVVIVDPSFELNAPPDEKALFEVIVQSFAMKAAIADACAAPPWFALFEVITL